MLQQKFMVILSPKCSKVLIGFRSICKRTKLITVSVRIVQAGGLGSFFKNLGRISAKTGKNLATDVLENPGRALEFTSHLATAAATKSHKVALSSLPEVNNFYHTGRGLYLGKFV